MSENNTISNVADRNIVKDIVTVLTGNTFALVIAFISSSIISINLGPEKFGIYSFFVSFLLVFTTFCDLGFSVSSVKYMSENKNTIDDIAGIFFISKLLFSIFVAFILAFFSQSISLLFFKTQDYSMLLAFVSFCILFHSSFGSILSYYQAKEKFRKYAYLNILHAFLRLLTALIIIFCFMETNLTDYLIISYSIAITGILSGLLLLNLRKIVSIMADITTNSFKHLKNIFNLSSWVFISSLINVLMMRMDIFFLTSLSNEYELGIFSLALILTLPLAVLSTSISNSLLPKMSKLIETKGISSYFSLVFHNSKLIILTLLVLCIFGPTLISFVYGSDYEDSGLLFSILVIARGLGIFTNPLGLLFYQEKKHAVLTMMNFMQLIMCATLHYTLIPIYGALGAALATSIYLIFGFLFVTIYSSLIFVRNK